MTDVRVLPAGDSALVLRIGDRIDPAVNARALAVARDFRSPGETAIRDVVVGYASVTVYFDPLEISAREIEERLRDATSRQRPDVEPRAGNVVVIPVRYGGSDGPDLSEVAAFAACTEGEVIQRHLAREYRVFMIGFLPGFPYMGVVDERIAMPRRETPRLAVPAGSVGIAGLQTGVYPVQSPGGWRLIGRTDVGLFDAGQTPPTLLQPGDTVRFARES
jgi:KipI family sensor histidine kinase inhibitor